MSRFVLRTEKEKKNDSPVLQEKERKKEAYMGVRL